MRHIRELEEHQEEFHRLGCKVVAVHYYKMENLIKWRNYTKCQHQTIADPQRLLYKLFGIGHIQPKKTIWKIQPLQFYASLRISLKDTVPLQETEPGDTFLVGGDVVVDSSGRVIYIFRSQRPPEKPSVDDIITLLREDRARKTSKAGVNL